ncbi:MAG TPA: DUF3795 domain-containing protein [Bacteroidales bacterium]|nr:DUF3795 domain-containing protein [Bacteroidales bacterium]
MSKLQNKFKTSVVFDRSMIAPCGLNCGSCIGFMRPVNTCPGCRNVSAKSDYCRSCIIKNCDKIAQSESGYCYECSKFPCKRMKQLDKRYLTRYRTSLVDNLMLVKYHGMDLFLRFETNRRKCPECGATLSIHRDHCLACSRGI